MRYLTKFEEAWALFPRKEGKSKAFIKFRKTVKSDDDYEKLKTAIKNFRTKIVTEDIAPKFIMHGSTFFNNWVDYVDWKPVEDIRNTGNISDKTFSGRTIINAKKWLGEGEVG